MKIEKREDQIPQQWWFLLCRFYKTDRSKFQQPGNWRCLH